MDYKCKNCGLIFEDNMVREYHDTHGLGYGSADNFEGCPDCGGSFDEAHQCEICGHYYIADEMNGKDENRVCDECINKYRYDFDVCFKLSKDIKDDVEINTFLMSVFKVEEIEKILFDFLKNSGEKIDCLPFIKQDRDWFADKLIEEVIGE